MSYPQLWLSMGSSSIWLGAVGPGIGGFVVAAVGVGAAFAFNAFSFLGVIAAVKRWKRPARKSTLPAETFRGATSAAIRYVRYSPGIRTLLLRSAVPIFFTSSFWALLPTAARELSKSPIAYGFLLGSVGLGAVLGAMVLQRTRSKLSTETLLSFATATFAAIVLSLALLRTPVILCFLMLFGGFEVPPGPRSCPPSTSWSRSLLPIG